MQAGSGSSIVGLWDCRCLTTSLLKMFFVYGDNIGGVFFTRGVLAIVLVQILAYLLSIAIAVQPLQFADGYPVAFVPILFSLKPALYSYSLITSAFLHSGLLHLVGNIMFFLAFGKTLERLLGTLSFLGAYLLLGAMGFLGSWLISADSTVPIVGSSGAVAFLMGAYLVLFPQARLKAIFTIPPFYKRFGVRAYVFVLVWAVLQVFSVGDELEGKASVAYATHLLGFCIGLAAAACWKEFATDTEARIANVYELRGYK